MILNKKRFFFTFFFFVCLLIVPAFVAAETSFSAYAGVMGDFYSQENDDNDFDPALNLQGYFAGQINLTSSFLVRLEFSLETQDVIDDGPFSDSGIDSHFFIDEISATYIKPFLGNTQYLSLFFGTFEPIGSDVFLQRQFGIAPISSLISESWLGLRGSTVYPFYGAGGSYILHLDAYPIATGAYLYFNKENEEKYNQLNLDWRFASVLPYLAVDFAIGLGAPLATKQGNEDVIMLIDTLYLHTGINFLIGNKYSTSLFAQGGIRNLEIKAGETKHDIKSNDIYLVVEPRLVTKKFQAHVTMFSVPEGTVEKLIFIEDTFGFNLNVFTDNLYVKNKNITFGIHTTWSFKPDKKNVTRDFLDLKNMGDLVTDTDHFRIKVSPFVSIPVMSGTLHAMFQATITDIKADTWQNAFKLSVGYKSRI